MHTIHLADALMWTMSEMDFNVERPLIPALFRTKEGAPFIPDGRVIIVSAAGGTGKSRGMTQMALSLATGTPWMGTFEPGRTGTVLLVFAEDDRRSAERRFLEVTDGLGLRGTDQDAWRANVVSMTLQGFTPRLLDTKGRPTDWYRRLHDGASDVVAKRGIGMAAIVLDPISLCYGPEAEKDNAAAADFIALCGSLSSTIGGNPTVALTHHTNKFSRTSGAQELTLSPARGATALTDGPRLSLVMSRNEESGVITLTVHKGNDYPRLGPFYFKMTKTGILAPTSESPTQGSRKDLCDGSLGKREKRPAPDQLSSRNRRQLGR